MYAPIMWKCFSTVAVAVALVWALTSCHMASREAAAPLPESEQAIREAMKELYMAASTAAPHSAEQQRLILRMAKEANNGKELMLAMRAAVGVFPAPAAAEPGSMEAQVHSTVTGKMLRVATLDQLVDYAAQYTVGPEYARQMVERMFELGNGVADARVWFRIRATAFHLGVGDLELQARAKADELSRH